VAPSGASIAAEKILFVSQKSGPHRCPCAAFADDLRR
jgi:hypothetical protein